MFDGLFEALDLVAARAAVAASRGKGDESLVAAAERTVAKDPAAAIAFDAEGAATVVAGERRWAAGRFETPTLGELRARVAARPRQAAPRVRLTVLLGTDPVTDVGALQAVAAPGTLFQVASQLNCLESPGAYLVPVSDYRSDPTQGPRAAWSAFPGALVRHYAAPRRDGTRFTQTDGEQLNLLADAVPADVATVEHGYLIGQRVKSPAALAAALEGGFERLRVGVHAGIEVVLGHDWSGSVAPWPDGRARRISQVLTSTYAHGYSAPLPDRERDALCRPLLRAAYLGTLLAALALGDRTVVLTAIGGGVFANPHPVIWEAILWAVDEAAKAATAPLDVVLNARDLRIDRPTLAAEAAKRGGVLALLERGELTIPLDALGPAPVPRRRG